VTQIPAGWYPDPTAPPATPPHLRYWDGNAWTEHAAASPGPAAYAAGGPTTPDGVPLAGWWWRVLAYVIDGFVVGVPAALASLPAEISAQDRINGLTDQLDSANPDWGLFWHTYADILRDQLIWQLPFVLLGVAYFVVMLRWKGATLGQLATGLQVRLREAPGRLPWRAICLRVLVLNVLGMLPTVFLALGAWPVALVLGAVLVVFTPLNLLWPLWDKNRQALHDKLARTNVVKVR
jgi:uncharacterized RDD family membrane protein YckC